MAFPALASPRTRLPRTECREERRPGVAQEGWEGPRTVELLPIPGIQTGRDLLLPVPDLCTGQEDILGRHGRERDSVPGLHPRRNPAPGRGERSRDAGG